MISRYSLNLTGIVAKRGWYNGVGPLSLTQQLPVQNQRSFEHIYFDNITTLSRTSTTSL